MAAVSASRASRIPSWNGIVPLHSTRTDVERRLGSSEDTCRCLYRTADETVFVEYATGLCEGPVYGWEVPADTVLQFTVTPRAERQFSELGLDESRFVIRSETPTAKIYTDAREGVTYFVQHGILTNVRYIPSTNDARFRCEGFPAYDGGVTQYRPYFNFTRKTETDTAAYLDQFAFQLSAEGTWDGYIIAYAGKVSERGEAKAMAERAKAYLVNKRSISPRRVTAIDGGFRETAEMELYLIRHTMPAPTPTPTLSPKAVIVTGRAKVTVAKPVLLREKALGYNPPLKIF